MGRFVGERHVSSTYHISYIDTDGGFFFLAAMESLHGVNMAAGYLESETDGAP